MTFTMEEVNNNINFLDITICKTNHKIHLTYKENPLQRTLLSPMTLVIHQNKS